MKNIFELDKNGLSTPDDGEQIIIYHRPRYHRYDDRDYDYICYEEF